MSALLVFMQTLTNERQKNRKEKKEEINDGCVPISTKPLDEGLQQDISPLATFSFTEFCKTGRYVPVSTFYFSAN